MKGAGSVVDTNLVLEETVDRAEFPRGPNRSRAAGRGGAAPE